MSRAPREVFPRWTALEKLIGNIGDAYRIDTIGGAQRWVLYSFVQRGLGEIVRMIIFINSPAVCYRW